VFITCSKQTKALANNNLDEVQNKCIGVENRLKKC
jgi:hypothetical protein